VQKIAKIVVDDYPYFSNAFFSYAVAKELEQTIAFGSLVQVPFGLSNNLRLGLVIDFTQQETPQIKEVRALLSPATPLTEASLSYLMHISYSFFYPLSLLLKMAGIFPPKKSIRIHYAWTEAFLNEIRADEKLSILANYIAKHPHGFYEDLLQKKMHWKKSSPDFKKIRESKNLIKTFEVTYPSPTKPVYLPSFSGIGLLNQLNSEQRFEWLEAEIQKYQLEKVLLIVPSRQKEMMAKSYFAQTACKAKVSIQGKHAILKLDQKYSLIFIEDSLHMAYSWDMPFSYPIEKTAYFRSMETGEAVVLGSYIPSLNAFQQLQLKLISHVKYGVHSTKHLSHPKLSILSMNKENKEHGYALVPFSILRKVEHYLNDGKKIFLLHNRKGYYNYLLCKSCGYVAKCPKCQIVQSIAPSQDHSYCRYCRQTFKVPTLCPECNELSLRFHTPGTQKIESTLLARFFGKRILRIDKDNVDEQLKLKLRSGDYDILVGTILALEHLDFKQISLCVWLGLDSIVNYPGFSSEEKALCLLSRIYEKMLSENEVKELVIPSYSPQSELLRAVKSRHLASYYQQMLKTRKLLAYPPYIDWFEFILASNDEEYLEERVKILSQLLAKEKKLELKSIKKIAPGKVAGDYAFSLLFTSSEIIESSSFLCGIIDEYKKNEKISCKLKVLE
jgi:primosomal protein N'